MCRFFKKKQKNTDNKSLSIKPESQEKLNYPLVENLHFYIENGNYVFTGFYLKNRGYCCEGGEGYSAGVISIVLVASSSLHVHFDTKEREF